jgi:peptidoglycan/LPS O-acetylase OafA/YrhL
MQIAILFVAAVLFDRSLPTWTNVVALHIPMLQFVDERATYAINPVYWTLPVELSFYLCLPKLAQTLWRAEQRGTTKKWAVLAIMITLLTSISLVYRHFAISASFAESNVFWLARQFPGTLPQFAAGVSAASILRWCKLGSLPARKIELLSTFLAAAGLVGVILMMYLMEHHELSYLVGGVVFYVWHPIVGVCAAAAILGVALGGSVTRVLFENRLAVWLGTISYSIYLWHWPVLAWLHPHLDDSGLGLAGYYLASVPLILVAAALSYYTVERTFLSTTHVSGEAQSTPAQKSTVEVASSLK